MSCGCYCLECTACSASQPTKAPRVERSVIAIYWDAYEAAAGGHSGASHRAGLDAVYDIGRRDERAASGRATTEMGELYAALELLWSEANDPSRGLTQLSEPCRRAVGAFMNAVATEKGSTDE